jgi:hypothetical protein
MKQQILVVALSLAALQLVGCSSTKTNVSTSDGISPGTNSATAISDQRLAVSDFKRQGIKIGYTLSGEIDFIETTGYAAVWGSSQSAARESYRVAELEAKKTLNDFINKESISSRVSVAMISENLEHAKDQKTNRFDSNKARGGDELVAVDDPTTVTKVQQQLQGTNSEENQAIRNDSLRIASKLSTTITTQNQGILGGLYLVEAKAINDGKNVKVVYRWDRKNQAARTKLRTAMSL